MWRDIDTPFSQTSVRWGTLEDRKLSCQPPSGNTRQREKALIFLTCRGLKSQSLEQATSHRLLCQSWSNWKSRYLSHENYSLGMLSGQWEEADLSWRVTVPPILLAQAVTIKKSWSLSVALKTAETKFLPVASVMSGRWDGACLPFTYRFCSSTVLLWVNFFFNMPRRDIGKGSTSCRGPVPTWVYSLCWSKQRYSLVTSAKSSHFLLSKEQVSLVSIPLWGLPWLPMNFAKWASRWSQAQAQLGSWSIAQQGQGHLVSPERLTCDKQPWLEGRAHQLMQHW